MPVAIKFGTKTEKIEQKENLLTQKIKKKTYKTVGRQYYNNPNPAWTNYQLNYQMKTIKNFYH
jgi:molecular chaperone HtpG